MTNKKKIKLREQKEIVPFIMAVFKGANINERWNGAAIITHFFEDLCDKHFDFFSPNTFTYCKNQYAKIKTLIYFGADTSEVFQKNIYKKLLFGLCAQMTQILLMLSCGSLLNKITGYRRELLKAFQQELINTARSISKLQPPEHTEKHIADVSELFGNVEGVDMYYQCNSMNYDSIIISATNKLILLSALLGSKTARQEMTSWRYEALKSIRQFIIGAHQVIVDTKLTAGIDKTPDWFCISKEYIDKLKEASAPKFKREFTEEDMKHLYDINDILEEDLGLDE